MMLTVMQVTYQQPHILLLDEPSNHLDLDAVQALIQVMRINACIASAAWLARWCFLPLAHKAEE